MTLEGVLDDVLHGIALGERSTTRRKLARDTYEDPALVRAQLRREATAAARAQYRRNEEEIKRKRKAVKVNGHNRPSVFVASSRFVTDDAQSMEHAADFLLQSRAESKPKTRGRKMLHDDKDLDIELIRAFLLKDLQAWKRDMKPRATSTRTIRKGMR